MSTDELWHDWIRRAREGDREAFDRLARENEGPLRSLIDIQLGEGLRSRVEVDDLLQEALLRVFQSMGAFEGETPAALRAWLAGIVHNAVVDRARRLTTKKADYRREVPLCTEPGSGSGGDGPTRPEIPSPSPSPSRVLRREERLDRLLEAVQTLSPDHRQVILLTLVERLPAPEVARRMARSEKAVSMLLLRAMRALREVFGEAVDTILLGARAAGEVTAWDGLFIAMALKRQGLDSLAADYYGNALRWMARHPDLAKEESRELRSFREEAAGVLGLESPPVNAEAGAERPPSRRE